MEAGHKFNVGVVYLPPAAVRDGVFELIRVNRDIEKIIILTEKVSVHDAREIRALASSAASTSSAPTAWAWPTAWNHVRIGGALGGDKPEEILAQGLGGDLSPTPATSPPPSPPTCRSAAGAQPPLISSGKDVYINFAPPEFAYAFDNDDAHQGGGDVLEPGGYYEEDVEFKKPVVACVVGRWKAKLTRAVGHAGAIAGSGRRRRGQGKVVPWTSPRRRRQLFTAGKSRVSPRPARSSPTSRISRGADRGDGAQRHGARFRARRRPGAEALVRRQPGPAAARRTRHSRWSSRLSALRRTDRRTVRSRSARSSRASP